MKGWRTGSDASGLGKAGRVCSLQACPETGTRVRISSWQSFQAGDGEVWKVL